MHDKIPQPQPASPGGAPPALRERRYPTGLTVWGPLPGTAIMHILWPGPGSGLFLVIGQPDAADVPMTRIEHAAASGIYDTRAGARRAVHAFIAADGGGR